MNSQEAAELVDVMIDSIRREPAQFHFDVAVVGQNISSSGGTGLGISAKGGGPGSTTIGQVVSVEGTQVEIARRATDQVIQQQFEAVVKLMTDLALELRSAPADREKIDSILTSLKQSWVPNLIISLIANLISKSIG